MKKDYLETLSAGKHTLTVVYTDGECTTEFQVKAASATEDTKPGTEKPVPSKVDKKTDVKSEKKKSLNTAYSDNMGQWMALLLMSGFVLVLSMFRKKKN